MLDALNFVKGAVAKKDPVPALTHFSIKDGFIKGYNGRVALCAPIALNLDCRPKAIPFTKALSICEGIDSTVSLTMTSSGRLTVKCGGWRAHIECIEDEFPCPEPEGDHIDMPPSLMAAFKTLAPLVAEDASRPWARGILIREGSAFATNNVVIGQYWTGVILPFDLNIPDESIRELLRIKRAPVGIRATPRSATFVYDDGSWLSTMLLTTEWPDVRPVLDRACERSAIHPEFFSAIERLAAYADETRKIHFYDNGIRTHISEGVGSVAELEGWNIARGSYNVDQLKCLSGLVSTIDWTLYPAPALFFGDDSAEGYPLFRGAIVGYRPNAL